MRSPKWLGFQGKTLWDWLQLLIVPAILIAVTFAWSFSQTRSDNKREDRRSQDATLQAYLDQMSRLMLDKNLLLSKKGDGVRAVARTVTLTALRRLDGARKAEVVKFLYEAGLLDVNRRVNLDAADLAGVHFAETGHGVPRAGVPDLRGANLAGADLAGADLDLADLAGANL